MSSSEHTESPRKRTKLSSETWAHTEPDLAELAPSGQLPTMYPHDTRAAHTAKETEVGITDYVCMDTPAFQGVLKKRYTDFLVNEILPNGRVVHLQKLGSAAVSQPHGKSAENGRGSSSSGVPSSNPMNSTPAAITVFSGTDEKSKQQRSAVIEEGNSPVWLLDLDPTSKLTNWSGSR